MQIVKVMCIRYKELMGCAHDSRSINTVKYFNRGRETYFRFSKNRKTYFFLMFHFWNKLFNEMLMDDIYFKDEITSLGRYW